MTSIIYAGGDTTNLRSQFRRRAAEHSRRVPGAYRRIPGYADDGEEEEFRCYRDVVCLVQAGGLGAADRLLEKFLEPVVQVQGPVTGSWSSVVLAFDGSAELRLHPQVLCRELMNRGAARRWAEQLDACSAAGPTVATPALIPELFPDQVAMAGKPKKRLTDGDLVLVFGRRGEFGFATELAGALRGYRKQVVVVEVKGARLVVTFDDAQGFLGTAMAGGANYDTSSKDDTMRDDLDWTRKPRDSSGSAADVWTSTAFTDEEKAIAEEIRAEEEDRRDGRPRRVSYGCLDTLQRAFKESDRPREEDSLPGSYLELIYLPDLEDCPVFGRGPIRSIEDSIGDRRESPGIGLPFLEGGVGQPCARYRPLHIYHEDWGIEVNSDCIGALAKFYGSCLAPDDTMSLPKPLIAAHLVCLAAETLVHREAYRHNLESFGARLREVETDRRPDAYLDFYRGIRRTQVGGTRHLENALAVAHARRALTPSRTNSFSHPREIAQAAIEGLERLLNHPRCMPSYRDGLNYFDAHTHRAAEWDMMQRIHEGVVPTRICGDHWQHAPRMTQGIVWASKIPLWLV